ncbi:hypothetical protein T4C_12929, partial [Trichinella pseudospiralis]
LLSATTRHAISASAFISASVRKRSNPWQQTERIVSAWRFSLFSNVTNQCSPVSIHRKLASVRHPYIHIAGKFYYHYTKQKKLNIR